jgi:hypothetical protein
MTDELTDRESEWEKLEQTLAKEFTTISDPEELAWVRANIDCSMRIARALDKFQRVEKPSDIFPPREWFHAAEQLLSLVALLGPENIADMPISRAITGETARERLDAMDKVLEAFDELADRFADGQEEKGRAP